MSTFMKTRLIRKRQPLTCSHIIIIASCALAACRLHLSTSGRHNVSVHTVHRQEAVTVSPEICQNNNHLQNKSVILTDNFEKNKQP